MMLALLARGGELALLVATLYAVYWAATAIYGWAMPDEVTGR